MKSLPIVRPRTVYRLILKSLPKPSLTSKPLQNLTLLTMAGYKHFDLLQESLFSLHSTWSFLPKIHVVSDGTITPLKMEKALQWWPGAKSFSSWDESILYHQQRERYALIEFASSNVMGKKLAIILQFGEQGPTLWCDSDILWFKELSILPLLEKSGLLLPVLKIAEDYQPSYDKNLIKNGLEHLYKPPYRNAGLIYLHGDLINSCNLQPLLELAAQKPCDSAEQTIFAEAAYRLGSDIWSRSEIACFADDTSSAIPNYSGKKWTARHYVGPVRHLFWRDAFMLRLGLKRSLFDKGRNLG